MIDFWRRLWSATGLYTLKMPVKGDSKKHPKQGRSSAVRKDQEKPPVVIERVSDEEFRRVQETVMKDYADVFRALADA